MAETHYQTLGVPPQANRAAIETAYKALMKRHHPDAQTGGAGADGQAKAINEAYRVLRNPETRGRYDRDLAAAQPLNGRRPPHDEVAPTDAPTNPSAIAKETNGPISLVFMLLAVMVIVGGLGSVAVGLGLWRLDPSQTEADATIGPPSQDANSDQSASSSPTNGPSFDCNTADTEVLRMICESPELAADDAAMSAAYEDALRTSLDRTTLENEQSQWLLTRDRMAPDRQALADFYTVRIGQLQTDATKSPSSF